LLAVLTSFAGSRLFGQVYGSDVPWVLALHGWRRDHRDFTPALSAPPPLDAIALDLPGFGGTPPPETPWGSARYAEALLPLLEEMASSVVLVGHSFGGRVAVHLARMQPDRIGGLVLTGVPLFRPPGAPTRPRLRYRAVRRLARSGLVSESRLEAYRQRYGSDDYKAATGVMRQILVALLAEQYDAELAAITCPVELVWGDADTASPLFVAERIRDSVAGPARLTVCGDTGHLTPTAVPAELRAAIERLRP
jgi:pimeloyl-ACP methyl ester carboxylesterase